MTFSVDALLESLLATPPRLPSEAEVRRLCAAAKDALLKDSNAPAVPAPVSVVGDVHGQFFDLLELFRVGGMPPDTNYVFLGDLVDRGHDSVLCACLLAVLKIRWPERVWLVRGNHECRAITQVGTENGRRNWAANWSKGSRGRRTTTRLCVAMLVGFYSFLFRAHWCTWLCLPHETRRGLFTLGEPT